MVEVVARSSASFRVEGNRGGGKGGGAKEAKKERREIEREGKRRIDT